MSIPKKRLLQVLEQIAPTRLAESWDNVGLLLDIEKPYLDSSLYNVFLTIDLTPQVLDEAIEKKADFIISYHPSWFSSLKRLVSDPNNMDTSILQRCAQNGIPLFSPHTCLDTIEGGMNDYVAEILSGGSCSCVPIKLLPCQLGFPPSFGLGRITTLEQSTTLKTIIDRWKQYSGVKFLRVALPDGESNLNREIKTIGICVGSGGSLFRDIPKNSLPDLLFTGEMGHHELRSFSFNYNVPVVLTEHSNCERGFLQDRLVPMLLKQLSSGSGKCENYHFIVSEKDRDPIQIV